MNFTNLNSTAVSDIVIKDDQAAITFTGSGKTYNYVILGDNFVNDLTTKIENNQSVGQFINRAIKEDQTLRIVAV